MSDKSIVDLNLDEARALIGAAADNRALDAFASAEQAHEEYDGGRKGVLAAIGARRKELDGGAPWREDEWNGLPHYQCTRCRFETLDESRIRVHVTIEHGVRLAKES